jgi:hypothetical protein
MGAPANGSSRAANGCDASCASTAARGSSSATKAGGRRSGRIPRHFTEGASIGVRDLPGTDPLPFAWDAAKVGRMGSCLPIEFDARHPWRSLREALGSAQAVPARFATLESVPMFLRNQAGMQLRKRFAH